jgi:hypothetical protein
MNIVLDRASYVFDPSSQTIEFLGEGFDIARLKLITNKTNNEIIYNFADATAGNGGVSGNLLTLVYDTTSMNASDPLQVVIDVPEDDYAPQPIWGRGQNGTPTTLSLTEAGQVVPADGKTHIATRAGAQTGTVILLDTIGFNSVVVQLQGTFTGTISFQVSNDTTTWAAVAGWATTGAAAPVTTATAVGQWVFPCAGRYFRVQVTTGGSGAPVAVVTLKSFAAWSPQSTPTMNIGAIGASTLAAEDSAATTVPMLVGGIVRTALPAATVVAGDAVRATFSRSGQLVFKQFAPGDLDFIVNTTVTTATQTAIRAAQGANICQNVTQITYQNTNATATTLTIQDASATLIAISVPASMTLAQQLTFPTPLRGSANAALNYTAGTTGASVLLNVTGFNSY